MNLPKILKVAREASLKSDYPEHQLGAVLVDSKGRIYSASCNFKFKTHPLSSSTRFKTLHAEASAILAIRHKTDFSKLQLFVYREFANGKLALSKPCEHCLTLIKNYGIKIIWYTTPDGLVKEVL